MTDLSEKQTIEYFVQGIKKASGAAQKLAAVNQTQAWNDVVRMLDQLAFNAKKMYEGKPQTRLQTLSMAAKVMDDVSH